jgi:hypothetical protein
MTTGHHPARINLKLRELSQLFNSMDPSPFLDRDLDHDAEEFIVSWAGELPASHGFELVIHLTTPSEPDNAADVQDAVQHYFATRAEMKRREFRQLLRRGHISLLIGLVFLSLCLVASGFAARLGAGSAAGIVDWWPLRDEWRNLQRLARMRVRLVVRHGAGKNDGRYDPPSETNLPPDRVAAAQPATTGCP